MQKSRLLPLKFFTLSGLFRKINGFRSNFSEWERDHAIIAHAPNQRPRLGDHGCPGHHRSDRLGSGEHLVQHLRLRHHHPRPAPGGLDGSRQRHHRHVDHPVHGHRLSDRTRSRWGRRRPYILFGYILWGLATILFPTVAYIKIASLTVIMVVIADAIMTFFGSTANDAAFNAWTADIAPTSKRGRVEGVLNVSLFIAQIVSLVAAGILIESLGYFTFFYALGGIVLLTGAVAGGFLKEPPSQPTMSIKDPSGRSSRVSSAPKRSGKTASYSSC